MYPEFLLYGYQVGFGTLLTITICAVASIMIVVSKISDFFDMSIPIYFIFQLWTIFAVLQYGTDYTNQFKKCENIPTEWMEYKGTITMCSTRSSKYEPFSTPVPTKITIEGVK